MVQKFTPDNQNVRGQTDRQTSPFYVLRILVCCFNAINYELNSKTNIDALDKLTTAFNDLFNTPGITGFDHKYNIVEQSFAVYNAIGLGVERGEKRNKKKTEGATVNLSEDVQFKLDKLNDQMYKIAEFMFHLIKHYYVQLIRRPILYCFIDIKKKIKSQHLRWFIIINTEGRYMGFSQLSKERGWK